MRKSGKITAYGEVYNVKERMEEAGVPGGWDEHPDWYEYEMFLLAPDGEIIAEWDSFTETYNGVQRLDKQTAEKSVKEIVDDVKAGKAESWFTVPSEFRGRASALSKQVKKRAKSKKPGNTPMTLGGIR